MRSIRNIIILISILAFFSCGQKKEADWNTLFERSNYLETDRYKGTIEYFERLAGESSYAVLETIGISPQGRELKVLIVASDGEFTPQKAKKSSKPILLIENGIHSGEIEGKDACMLLLREMLITKEKEEYLDNLILLVVPVFNVDGHERMSPYNRINQNGPVNMGWRTTAQNLNLNRDFAKADAPEMQALLKLFSSWLPDFFIDTHTTDGLDHQYTITYAIEKNQNQFHKTSLWIKNKFNPFVEDYVNNSGFLISPYVSYIDREKIIGIRDWIAGPRYSNGYAAIQNRPGLLIETHVLKPYKDRVFSTKSLIEATIVIIREDGKLLKEMNAEADEYASTIYSSGARAYPIKFSTDTDSSNTDFLFKGVETEKISSQIAGTDIIKYTNRKYEKTIPYYNIGKVIDSISLPKHYLIPREWEHLVRRMELHGIKVEQVKKPTKFVVEKFKFYDVSFSRSPYEGRFSPSYKFDSRLDTLEINEGNFIVPTNQRSVGMIAYLLEPKSDESFLKWGFFNAIFERKEYFEMYSMQPIAQEMYDSDYELKKEFDALVQTDPEFAGSPRRRMNFFYERSEYFDVKLNVYPIFRVVKQLEN